jgi:hypothetical protein
MNYLVKMGILGILWVNGIIRCNNKIITGLNQELTTNKQSLFHFFHIYYNGRDGFI